MKLQSLRSITHFVPFIILSAALFVAQLAHAGLAQDTDGAKAGEVGAFLANVLGFINGVLLPLILGIAFLMFVWGVFQFFILGGSDEEAQSKGKSLMIYAVAGFVLILSFYGIVNVITNGFGFKDKGTTAPDVETGFTITP